MFLIENKMELNFLIDEKDKLKLEIKGEGHTLCNPLNNELWEDEHIKVAGYNIEHSLVSSPVLIVETDGKETAKSALKKAVGRLEKKMDELKDKFKQLK